MRVLVSPDSFKGGAGALVIAQAMARGVVAAGAVADVAPMADGGEGTTDVLRWQDPNACTISVEVSDAFGRRTDGWYCRLGTRAVVEAAIGSGYTESRPQSGAHTTSYGTGQLVAAAMADPKVDQVVVALGGTGCTDGGFGFLSALGVRCRDREGRELEPWGDALASVAGIDWVRPPKPIIGWYDVAVPLLGESGSVRLFGPQKGVAESELASLEAAMARWSEMVHRASGYAAAAMPGSGAAGGIGFAIRALGGDLALGGDRVADWVGLDQRLADADLCITGEGRFDGQTRAGKVVACVARRAKAMGVPTVVLAGSLDRSDASWLSDLDGFAFGITDQPMTLTEAIGSTERLVEREARTLVQLLDRFGTRLPGQENFGRTRSRR